MAIVVIGGHSRSVGKTSVVAGLIAALREFQWTAAKITQYGHGVCSASGKVCDCACDDHSWAITEERDRSGESDTSRFLVAGAKRSLWVRTEQGKLGDAIPAFLRQIQDAPNVILESNSVLRFLEPDLYLSVLDPAVKDFKNSAREFLDRADAIIVHRISTPSTNCDGVTPDGIRLKFEISPPPYVTQEIAAFVRDRVASAQM
ncbi:MAG TPA: hypothetical protein VFO39_04825 [Candidatus Sulfotelmatobacter sp.]|nr:hypothetical protein [Candidatus Sulfotelmatobacter sp.]